MPRLLLGATMSTNATPATTTPAPAKRRRRRWLQIVLVILALVILVPLLTYAYFAYTTGNAWAEAEAEAAKDDPNWKLMDIEANRKKLADMDNSALHIMATLGLGGGLSVN